MAEQSDCLLQAVRYVLHDLQFDFGFPLVTTDHRSTRILFGCLARAGEKIETNALGVVLAESIN